MSIAEKLTAIAENEQKVYDAGNQAAQTRFWNAYQRNGTRTDYTTAFAGIGWTPEYFQPRHSMKVTNGYMMFRMHNQDGEAYDLVEHLNALGVTLDFSGSTNMQYTFAMSGISHIGVVNCSSATSIPNLFHSSKAVTVDKLIVHSDLKYDAAFQTASNLQTITFEGVIGNHLDIHWSPLSRASMESIFSCLSSTSTGQTLSLSKAAVDAAFETASGLANGSSSQAWSNLVATKSNWTISLI